eukprot:CAMPEP_0197416436 /NCGR_PEP_ID=MMETSP1170-20131217/2744_1 /TAXON_ID=54406 /ORGANISM="Sarcinochrysis sp, Strain CCMP770" /LENGTH=271 /DNA_ID=CAMNT_0042943331 /DNA_START=113 /DNA_END=925 /DNA_ORIENTATION=+
MTDGATRRTAARRNGTARLVRGAAPWRHRAKLVRGAAPWRHRGGEERPMDDDRRRGVRLGVCGFAGDGDEVDAVAVALAVGEVVAEVGAGGADGLAVGKNADVVPVDLVVAEGGPAVRLGLLDKVFPAAVLGGGEEELAGVGVVKLDFGAAVLVLEEGRRLPVAGELGVVAVEVADAIGGSDVAVPAKALLDGGRRRAVGLGGHERLVAHHHRRAELLRHEVSQDCCRRRSNDGGTREDQGSAACSRHHEDTREAAKHMSTRCATSAARSH